MRRTVIGLFKSFHQAEKAINEIESGGYANNQISLVVKRTETSTFDNNMEFAEEFTANSASRLVQNLDSTLVKEDHIELPVIGPVNAGGPLAGALMQGDKTLAEALSYYGVRGERASEVENFVRDGYTLAVIETNNEFASEVANLLSGYGAHGVEKWSKSISKPLKPWN